jgi:hypothetical protein
MFNLKSPILLILFCGCFFPLKSQTEIDGLFMGKRNICGGFIYGQSQWQKYWEGDFLRTNDNIGQLKSRQMSFMANYGFTSKTNLILSTSYIQNFTTKGTLIEQKGFQDANLFLKHELWAKNINGFLTSLVAVAGVSTPISNYVVDYLPLSIGSGARTASMRFLMDIQKRDYFLTLSSSYIARSTITIDRNSYYTDRLIYSNQVVLPNLWNHNIRLGYRPSPDNYVEFTGEFNNSIGGFNIRKNDMPFPSNEMDMIRIGLSGKKEIIKNKGFSAIGGLTQTVYGKNVGKSFSWYSGLVYQYEF